MTKTRGYKSVMVDCKAEERRKRPEGRRSAESTLIRSLRRGYGLILFRSRTPRQIAGRLHLEASDFSVGTMVKSTDAQGRTLSHEAIYRWIYPMPKSGLAREGIIL